MGRRRKSSSKRKGSFASPTGTYSIVRKGVLAGLLLCLIGIVTLFGGTRFWALGPFLLPLLLLSGSFFFFTFVQSGRTEKGLSLPADFFFWLMIILYVAIRAAFFTSNPFETWTEFGFLLIAWLLYGLFSDLGNEPGAWTFSAYLLLFAVLFHALWALSLHWHGARDVLWLTRPLQYGARVSGTYICPNHFGHFIQMGSVIAFGIMLTPRARLSLRIFSGYVLIPCLIVQVLTHSRSGVLGTFVGLSLICFGKALRKGWKQTCMVLGFIMLAGFLTVAGLIKFYPPLGQRIENDVKNNIRLTQIWPDTWLMIQGEGFWGAGPGTYSDVFTQYREHFSSSRLYLEYAHNEFLNTLAEYGWLASLVFLVLCGWLVWSWLQAMVKTRSDEHAMIPMMMFALLGGTFAHALFDFNLHIPANGLLFVSLLGLLYGVGLYQGVWSSPKVISVRLTRSFAMGGSIACLCLMPLVFRLMMGGWAEYKMQQAVNAEMAFIHSEKFRKWNPWSSRGWNALGLWYRKKEVLMQNPQEKQRLIDLSRDAYEQAMQLNQHDKIALAGLVELARDEGQPEQALALIEGLRLKTPFDVRVRIQQGLILRELGQYQESLTVFEDAQKMQGGASRQIALNIRSLKRILSEEGK